MKIYTPFLLLLALLLEVTTIDGQFSCQQPPKTCDCLQINRETQLHCPTTKNRQVIVSYKTGNLQITCFKSTFDVGSLDLNIDNVHWLKTQGCKSITDSFMIQLRNASSLRDLIMLDTNLDDAQIKFLSNYTKKTLEAVSMSGNKLTKLPEGLNFLYELDLSSNQIKNLTEKIRFPSLQILELQQNNIERIDGSIFETSRDLVYIDLSQNNITELPAQLLHPLQKLKIFLLASNDFQKIPDGFFKMNPLLKEVVFSNGRLTEIGTNTFSNCTRLDKFKFANNSLKSLPEEMFLYMQNLTYIDLSFNEFSDLPAGTFKGLSHIKYLYLIDNKLTTWLPDHNDHIFSLKYLYLNKNSLTGIKVNTFSRLKNLLLLDLSNNLIATVEMKAFSSLTNLELLNLSFNKLTTPDVALQMVNDGALISMKINLSFNNITTITIPNYDRLQHSSSQCLRIAMNMNPINCDCKMFKTLKYIQAKGETKSIELSNREVCATPTELKGIGLSNINLDNFTCKNDELYRCPSKCNCRILPSKAILEINCSNAGLRSLPVINPLNVTPMELGVNLSEIWVDLSNNSITEFAEKDHSYKHVSVLNLSHNRLQKIHWIPPKSKVLYLDNNMLSEIDEEVLEMLNKSTTLKKVTFNENPWKCDCNMVHFAKTLRLHLMKMITNNTLTCADGTSLIDLHEATACGLEDTYIALIVILSLLTLVGIVLVILYVHFESHVKIWLYNHKLLLSILNENDIDKDMAYDAFISYSHKDEEFVVKHLVRELEQQEKYKLCLHERDWVVGEYIPKQIEDSVQNSRKTIIVLSKNFLVSDWANVEFKTAHSRSLLDERNRLIVILYEDIDMNDVSNKELKIYLNTKTYIKWGDPWFWKQLKQAMPVRKVSIKDSRKNGRRNRIVDIEKNIDSS